MNSNLLKISAKVQRKRRYDSFFTSILTAPSTPTVSARLDAQTKKSAAGLTVYFQTAAGLTAVRVGYLKNLVGLKNVVLPNLNRLDKLFKMFNTEIVLTQEAE